VNNLSFVINAKEAYSVKRCAAKSNTSHSRARRETIMDYRLLVLAFGTFAIGTDAYVVAGILPEVARSFDVSIAAAGQFVTVYAFAYAILSPVMATITAHWPRRRVLLAGLAVFIVGNILTATQLTFELALVSRAVAGLGAAMVTPTAGAMAAALVTPERRGTALAIVMAGLSAATALGAPIGTFVGSIGDWRLTIWLVVALGFLAAASMLLVLPVMPPSPALRLRERLAPLGDARVVAILATSLLVVFGAFLIYTYFSAVFERATGGDGTILAALLLIYGVTGTIGSLAAGRLIDRLGSRLVLNLAIAGLALNFALMPWSSIHFAAAAAALMLWSVCGWGFVVAQQHRLVNVAPALAPILLGLNASAMYLAISASGAVGALAMRWLPPYDLPLVSAALVICGAFGAEVAYRLIRAVKPEPAAPSLTASRAQP
jgi:predicted MFS family arabinose efflux permease